MISAKQARQGTKIDHYMEDKCREIEDSIKLSMELGLPYTRYMGSIPISIREMLETLGYKIMDVPDTMGFRVATVVISWGDVPDEDISCE